MRIRSESQEKRNTLTNEVTLGALWSSEDGGKNLACAPSAIGSAPASLSSPVTEGIPAPCVLFCRALKYICTPPLLGCELLEDKDHVLVSLYIPDEMRSTLKRSQMSADELHCWTQTPSDSASPASGQGLPSLPKPTGSCHTSKV